MQPSSMNRLTADDTAARMAQAGVKPITWVAVAGELQGDWRNPTGPDLARILDEHLLFYGNAVGRYQATKAG
jgi:hypothetical protein